MYLTYRAVVLCVLILDFLECLSASERPEKDMLSLNDIQMESQGKHRFNVKDYLESIHVDIA